jgi:hypothetical protein
METAFVQSTVQQIPPHDLQTRPLQTVCCSRETAVSSTLNNQGGGDLFLPSQFQKQKRNLVILSFVSLFDLAVELNWCFSGVEPRLHFKKAVQLFRRGLERYTVRILYCNLKRHSLYVLI